MTRLALIDNRAPQAEDVSFAAAVSGWQAVMVTPQDGIYTIGQRAIAAARRHGAITELRIMAHGAPGVIQLGQGLTEDSAIDLRPLRPHMRNGRLNSVWCFSCNAAAASGPDKWNKSALLETGWAGNAAVTAGRGYRLLRAIAAALGSNVHAPVDVQFMANWNYRGFFNGQVRFTGTELLVERHGAYRVVTPGQG